MHTIDYKIMNEKLSTENIDATLASTQGVMIDFFATWCGPCKMVTPLVDQLSTEYGESNPDNVIIGKIDIDQNPDLAQKFGVRSVPTMIFFKNGVEDKRIIGAVPKTAIKTAIDNLLGE